MIRPQSLTILQEIINIGVGKGAQVLNTLLAHHVDLSVPEVMETNSETLMDALGFDSEDPLVSVHMGYQGALQGEVQLIFPAGAAAQMVSLIVGDDQAPEEMDFISQATLTEVGNIVINAVVGTLSNLFGFHLQYTLPQYRGGTIGEIAEETRLHAQEVVLMAKTHFTIHDLSLEGSMLLCFSLPTYRALEEALERYAFG